MGIFKGFSRKKGRRYPVKRDKNGHSLRQQAFVLFDEEYQPSIISKDKMIAAPRETLYKYYRDWKRLGPNFNNNYAYVEGLLKKTSPDRDYNLDLFSRVFGIQKGDLVTILAKPHGLRRLMTGKFYFPRHADDDRKRQVALEVALFISDYLIKNGGTVRDVRFAFEHWMNKNQQYRKEEETDIEKENQEIAFTRKVIKAADKAEQQGRRKRGKLTAEERNAAIRYGLEAKMELAIRRLEKEYWFRIGELMGEGLTVEQARVRIYQDLLEKGDLKGAKATRQYQDIIHPMKDDSQIPPPTSQSLSPA